MLPRPILGRAGPHGARVCAARPERAQTRQTAGPKPPHKKGCRDATAVIRTEQGGMTEPSTATRPASVLAHRSAPDAVASSLTYASHAFSAYVARRTLRHVRPRSTRDYTNARTHVVARDDDDRARRHARPVHACGRTRFRTDGPDADDNPGRRHDQLRGATARSEGHRRDAA